MIDEEKIKRAQSLIVVGRSLKNYRAFGQRPPQFEVVACRNCGERIVLSPEAAKEYHGGDAAKLYVALCSECLAKLFNKYPNMNYETTETEHGEKDHALERFNKDFRK